MKPSRSTRMTLWNECCYKWLFGNPNLATPSLIRNSRWLGSPSKYKRTSLILSSPESPNESPQWTRDPSHKSSLKISHSQKSKINKGSSIKKRGADLTKRIYRILPSTIEVSIAWCARLINKDFDRFGALRRNHNGSWIP